MRGLVGKKVGMTSVFDEIGRSIPVTVVEVPAAVITHIKTEEKDGYNAVQLSNFDKKEKNLTVCFFEIKKGGKIVRFF